MEYEQFQREFEQLTGIRLALYKEKQMKRRILTLVERKKLNGLGELLARLRIDPAELAAFIDYITINVTEFFRTPEHWKTFEDQVLTGLADRGTDPMRIWSCACATGEEPYSLAMSCAGLMEPSHFSVIATDLDDKVLAKAREGTYPEKSLEQLPDESLRRFFLPDRKGIRVSDEIRSRVEFRRLDLLKDPYPEDCDLIVCRNVLIYFTEEAKNAIYGRFGKCLKKDGYLFTGNTEQIIYYKQYGYRKITSYLYQKL